MSNRHSANPTLEPAADRTRPRPASTVRIAVWSARHRWPVLLGWFAFTLGLFALSLGLGGVRAESATGASAAPQTESGRAQRAMSPLDAGADSEELDFVLTSSTLKVTDPAFRETAETIAGRLRAVTVTLDGSAGPALADVADPYAGPSTAGLLAADLTSVRIVGRLEGDAADIGARTRAVAPVIASIQADFPDYSIHAVGTTLLADQIADEINRDFDGSLMMSLPATFLILLLAFGALAAAGVPLVFAVTALLAAFGLFGIFSQVAEPVSPFAAQFIMLIGLAVAVDYSLFTITRFRTESRAGRDRLTAIEVASATSGRAVLFSGVAVMVSLAGLFLLPDPLFQSIALGTIAVILVSVIGSLVFLPAVLSILGDGIDRGRIPFLRPARARGGSSNGGRSSGGSSNGGRPGRSSAGLWARLVRGVMSHPIPAILGATAVLLALGSPVTRLHLGETDISVFPERVDGVQAVRALGAHWPQGTLLRLDVVVTAADQPATKAALERLQPALLAIRGLSGPAQQSTTPDGTAASVSVLMSGTQNDPANWQIVQHVRSQVVPGVFGALTNATVYVGGGAAVSMDQTQLYSDGMARIFVFVLGLSFFLLLLVFHSVVIPIKAILLNLLASGAAFGALVLVFQEGWFASALGITPTPVIQNWVPIFIFTVLFGLSMDYEVFILARIKEAFDRGSDSHEAVANGIALTAGTVTSAAAIMVVVFAIFLTLPLTIAREMGLGLAVAVFVDATLIRCVLLPATMRLLGNWNWWLPSFLGWLPRITIEGESAAGLASPGVAVEPAGVPVEPAGVAAAAPELVRLLPSGTGAHSR